MADLQMIVGRPADSVRATELGDGLSVFDAATGTAVALNRTAADVFALADGKYSVDDLVRILAEAYHVERGDIEAEVCAVVDQLADLGVLVAAR